MVILPIRRLLPIGRLAHEPSGDAAPAISAAGNGYPQIARFVLPIRLSENRRKTEPDFKLCDTGAIMVDGTA
jgi:hypothetical protein